MTITFMDIYGKLHIIESDNIVGYGHSTLGENTLLIRHNPNDVTIDEHIAFLDTDSLHTAIKRLEDTQKQACITDASVNDIEEARHGAIGSIAANLAINMLMNERDRQRGPEGFNDAHDNEHTEGQLGYMAAAYLSKDTDVSRMLFHQTGFDKSWYKPGNDETRKLVKGVALALAELERHIRSKMHGRVLTLNEAMEKLGIDNKCRLCPKPDCPNRVE